SVPSKHQEIFVMRSRAKSRSVLPLVLALCAFAVVFVSAQDRLRTMPGYEQFQKMQGQTQGAMVSGAVNAAWSADNTSFSYVTGGKAYRFDIATMKPMETGDAPAPAAGGGRGAVGGRAAGGGTGGGRGTPPAGQAGQAPPATNPGRSGGMQQAQMEMGE